MSLARWNDDRLDDLHTWVERTAKRVDSTATVVAAHDLQLVEIQRDKRARTEQRWALGLVVLTVFLGQMAGLVSSIVQRSSPPAPVTVRVTR